MPDLDLQPDVLWSIFLFSARWLFIGLIYAALLVVLAAVRQEMRTRVSAAVAQTGQLKVINGGSDPAVRPGALLPLSPETTLGADPGNDLVLADRFISGHHARLRWDGVRWWLQDLGSRNGTFVNGRRYPSHREQPVPAGATLLLGDMVFELTE